MHRPLIALAGLGALAYVGSKVDGAFDAFFADHGWVSPAMVILVLLCVVVVVVALTAALTARALGWGAQGLIVRATLSEQRPMLMTALLTEARQEARRESRALLLEMAAEQPRMLECKEEVA